MKSFLYYVAFCAACLLMVAASCTKAGAQSPCPNGFDGTFLVDETPAHAFLIDGQLTAIDRDAYKWTFFIDDKAYFVPLDALIYLRLETQGCVFIGEYDGNPIFSNSFESIR